MRGQHEVESPMPCRVVAWPASETSVGLRRSSMTETGVFNLALRTGQLSATMAMTEAEMDRPASQEAASDRRKKASRHDQ